MAFLNKLLFSLTLSVGITAVNAQVQPAVKNKQTLLHWMIAFVNLKEYSNDFVYDMKYATEDNFLKAKVYDCALVL
jgi:D-alanyl-D-alanine dipeptidase